MWGYTRVSTSEQTLDLQKDALAGKCKQDHLTSKRRSRLASRNVFVTLGGRCLSYSGSVCGNSGASESAVLRTRDANRCTSLEDEPLAALSLRSTGKERTMQAKRETL